VDGFVIDSNNPAIVGVSSVQTSGGLDIDARRGLVNVNASDVSVVVNNLNVQNNILQNFGQRGISLANDGAASSTGNTITGNVVGSFGWGSGQSEPGIGLFSNAYANLTNNTVNVPSAATGIAASTFTGAGSMIWSGNTVVVGADG